MALMELVIVSDQVTGELLGKDCMTTGLTSKVKTFDQLNKALVHILNNGTDGLLLDVDMLQKYKQDDEAMRIIKELKRNLHRVSLVVLASSESYALVACALEASSYLLKPWSQDDVQWILQRMIRQQRKRRVFIRTFGHFDVFIDNEPVYFHNLKAKELLALLVDRRGTVTMDMAVTLLWENHRYDENVKQLYRKAVNYLRSIMREYDVDFFVANRSSCYIKMSEVICDYYLLLEGDERTIADYNGQYMFEYAWAEITAVQLEKYVHYWRSKNQNKDCQAIC